MSENNRQRVSIPIRGLDTSSTDINAPDGAMQELHNLRYSGEAWRNVKPFQVLERVRGKRVANKIFRDFDTEDNESYIVSQFPVASDINITAYWWDVDGEYTSTTSATLKAGMSRVHIEEAQESFGWIELNIQSDDKYLYYTNRDSVPEDIIGWEVVYQHPADEDDVYISKRVYTFDGEEVADLLRVRIKDDKATVLSVIGERLPSDAKVSHFGRILNINSPSNKTIISFHLLDDRYIEFSKPTPPKITHSRYLCENGYYVAGNLKGNTIELFVKDYQKGSYDEIPFFDLSAGAFLTPVFINNSFYGEICYFAAYEMEDGQIISASPLSVSSSEPFSYTPEDWGYYGSINTSSSGTGTTGTSGHIAFNYPSIEFKKEGSDYIGYIRTTKDEGGDRVPTNSNAYKEAPASCGFAIQPLIKIEIPTDINRNLIRRVNIYSTRVNSLFSAEAIVRYRDDIIQSVNGRLGYASAGTIGSFMADNKLPKQPFYLMKSISVDEFSNGLYEMHITAELLENIEQKTAYEAIDMHTEYYESSIEYNNRLHIFRGNETSLYQPNELYDMDNSIPSNVAYTVVRIDQKNYNVKQPIRGEISSSFVGNRILSYPDYRATYIRQKNDNGEVNEIALESSPANNVSWAINDKATINTTPDVTTGGSTDRNRPTIERLIKNCAYFNDVTSAFNGHIEESNKVYIKNKVRVSAPNNPLVFPLANTYSIGSGDNEIIAVNSAAIEMSDSKFGEFPLYAFTKEGIFALQSGTGEVLYGAIVPLNYDKIINPNTLAVNYNIIYITDRGVHALYSNESNLISEKINDAANQPLLDFLKTAKFAYQHKYGEVILFNTDRDTTGSLEYPRAYTFSLGAKVWGTRDWNGGVVARELLNSGDLIEQTENSIILSDLNNEDRDDTASFRLVSRPIKFNTQEFKRIETMVARLQASPAEYLDIKIEGSNDLVNWVTLRDTTTQTASDINIRRTPCSCRYFRVSVDCTTMSDVAIMGFDFEYYMRFLHRMR